MTDEQVRYEVVYPHGRYVWQARGRRWRWERAVPREDWPADYEYILRCIANEAWRLHRRLPYFSRPSIQDLIQEGLIRAVQLRTTYDARKGKFTTLLVHAVRNHFADLLAAAWRHSRTAMRPVPLKMARRTPMDPDTEAQGWAELEILLRLHEVSGGARLEFDRIRTGLRESPDPETPELVELRRQVLSRLFR